MKDRVRISGGNGRSSKLMCPNDYNPASFSAFIQDLKDGVVYVDVTANNSTGADAGVSEVGTALNKANLLSDTTAQGFGFNTSGSNDVTVNDVLKRIGADYVTGTLTAGQTSLVLTDARITNDSIIDVYCEPLADGTTVIPEKVLPATGSLTLSFFESYSINIGVKVRVM